MRIVPLILIVGLAATSAGAQSKSVEVQRAGSVPSTIQPAENFTGRVRSDNAFQRTEPARIGGATVTFEPGARTAWHSHPLGQTLIVTAGVGWVQGEGGEAQTIRPGDVIWTPPGVKHWHGATPTTAMSHIAIAEALNGSRATWMEKVTDAEYMAGAKAN